MPSFRELADSLPAVSPETPFAALPTGILRPESRNPAFIEPTLTVREGDPLTAKVVLVAAPAAVGKSMFAAALAADRGAPLWDLGGFPVGSGSFLGKLTESHGIAALADVTRELTGGRYCVVFDALDEGYSLARSDNFDAFVLDLARQLGELAPERAAIVACGRTDTIDLTQLLLDEAGLGACVMTLDFFSPEAARQFVDVQLDQARHTAHRQFRAPFEQARDALFARVEASIGPDQDTGGIDAPSFLGYAPVLVALAGYLETGNYQALTQHLAAGMPSGSDSPGGLWAFLRGIVADLLEREQPKLVDNLPAHVRNAIPGDRLAGLYSPEEQCARLLARATGTPPPAADLPPAVIPEYEKSVNEGLGEHPFVGAGPEGFASVVFRDYVVARALATQSEAAAARGLALSRSFKPSPLLVRFFVECAEGQATPAIHPDDVDILYASAHAEELRDARASLTIEQRGADLDVEIITARGDLLEFAVAGGADASLAVTGRLVRSEINAPDWTVTLGRTGAETVIGPDVTITCDRVFVAATSLRIEARTADEAVTWQAQRVDHQATEFHLAGANRERFRLSLSEQPGYPWTGFVSEDAGARDGHEPAVDDAVRELKKLVTRFKPGLVSGRALTVPTKIIDVLVARGRVSPEMYDYALRTGLVTVAGKDCILHPQQFGLNIVDLRERRVTSAVREYLAGYLSARGS